MDTCWTIYKKCVSQYLAIYDKLQENGKWKMNFGSHPLFYVYVTSVVASFLQ